MADHDHAEETTDFKKWEGRLHAAKWYQKEVGNTDDRWGTFAKGLASDFGSKGSDRLDVNLVHGTTQLRLAPLYTSDPHVSVRPTSEFVTVGGKTVKNTERARFTEAELNYWIRELQLRTNVIRPCVFDMETTNHMYALVGYLTARDKMLVGNPDEALGRAEPNPLLKDGQPFCVRLSPRQVLVPSGSPEWEEHPWMAIGWQKPVAVVEAMFPEAKGIKGSIKIIEPGDSARRSSPILDNWTKTADASLVQIWQIWDKWTGKVYTIAEDWDEFLEEPGAWPWKTEGFPVAHARMVNVPDEFWGTPPMQMYWPQQMELNAARSASRARNNRTKNVIFMRADIAEEIREKYAAAADGEIIAVPLQQDEDIRKAIWTEPGLPAPNEAYANGSIQINDMLFTTGLGGQHRGQGDPSIGTATESANIEKWTMVRATDVGDRTRGLYIDIIRKIWMLLRQHPDEQRDRRILGPLGAEAVDLKYTLRELEGEFAFSIDIGTMLPDSPIHRQQLALSNYNLLRPDPEVDPQALILDLLDSQSKPAPSAYMAKLMAPEQEIQLMLRGLPVEAKLRDNHEQHRVTHREQTLQLQQALDGSDPRSPDGERLRLGMALMMAHRNQHAMFIEQITGQPAGPPAGAPVDQNELANSSGQRSGETDAEMGGNPVESGGSASSGRRGPVSVN